MSQKPNTPAVSHMFWFFVLPAAGFLIWASVKLLHSGFDHSPRDAFTLLDKIEASRNAGDRWQIAYSLSQELQKMIHDGSLQTLPPEKKEALYQKLSNLLDHHKTDSRLNRYVLLTVGQMQDSRGLEILAKHLNDPDPETKFFSAWGYIDILSKKPELYTAEHEKVISSWLSSDDRSLKKIATTFLAQKKNPVLIKEIETQFHDQNVEVRWNAAVALASVGDTNAIPALKEMFDLNSLRALDLKNSKDLQNILNAAYRAAQKLNSAEVFASIASLKAQTNAQTPEGKAILSVLR